MRPFLFKKLLSFRCTYGRIKLESYQWTHISYFDMNDDTHGYHTYDDVHGLTDAGKAYIKEMEDLGMSLMSLICQINVSMMY